MLPTTIPHGRTARRLEWAHLPPHVRTLVERRCGSPVVTAVSQRSGFTPGFASTLACADGSRHFVKAASTKAQRMFAGSLREEARKLAELPPEAPAPRLLWTHDADEWVVLGIEYVEARPPHRPWGSDDLDAALTMLAEAAEVLTPAPGSLSLGTIGEEFDDLPAHWEHVRRTRPGMAHTEEAGALAARHHEVTGGDSLVHTDVRDDNILIRPDGTALLCDWNWPVLGAPWIDTVMALIGPRGDGLDVEAVLTARPLTRDLPAESIDVLLALMTGYFFHAADQPVPSYSPHVREAQQWQGEVCWDWLCERRGWE